MENFKCLAVHTKNQPKVDWKCPKCGAGPEFFGVAEPDPDAHEDCTLIHARDELQCGKCGYANLGSDLLDEEFQNFEPCPCCGGTGRVPEEKAEYCRAMNCQV